MDGARLFNAAVALGVDAASLAAPVDSVCICLSKGLAAPVGSVVCGSKDFIRKARRARKALGGGMRQAGIIAAAGIVALTEMTERLVEDHINAKKLAEGLAEIDGLSINPASVQTNLVFCDVTRSGLTAAEVVERLAAEGVKVLPIGKDRFRAVTQYHISAGDIDLSLKTFAAVMK
jgi:threonine aldolase